MFWLKSWRRVPLAVLVAFTFLVGPASLSPAAELLVFERKGCIRCLAWESEIARVYPKTDEGKRAPLRRIDIAAARPADLAEIGEVKYTPTFVLVDKGREIGRIVGYNGDEFFWAEVDELLSRAP